MASTYEPIATYTLSNSNSSFVAFTSIPATYTDLRIVFTTTSSASVYGYFNNDTSSSYSATSLYGNGTSAGSSNSTNFSYAQFNLGAGINIAQPSMVTIDIFNYAGSTYKTALSTTAADMNGSGSVGSAVTLWRSTAAINSIGFVAYIGGTFQAGTKVDLYGIKAA